MNTNQPNSEAEPGCMKRLVRRYERRIEKRDRRIAGLERKIKRLEEALSWRTIDLESLSRNVGDVVQRALCNVRMIPVFGGKRDKVITEVRHVDSSTNSQSTDGGSRSV